MNTARLFIEDLHLTVCKAAQQHDISRLMHYMDKTWEFLKKKSPSFIRLVQELNDFDA